MHVQGASGGNAVFCIGIFFPHTMFFSDSHSDVAIWSVPVVIAVCRDLHDIGIIDVNLKMKPCGSKVVSYTLLFT